MDLVGTLNTYMQTAATALASGDPGTALNQALAAQAIACALPQLSRSAGTGGGSQAAQWDLAGIDKFVVRVRQQYGALLGVQSMPIEFREPLELAGQDQQFATGLTQ